MTTRIKGTARIVIDFEMDDDLTDLEAEQEFNSAILQASEGAFEYGYAEYDQQHVFNA